jgi:predicted GNAT family acetyltransferase
MVGVSLLTDADTPHVEALLAIDPVANCLLSARLPVLGISHAPGQLWGAFSGGRLTAAVLAGGNAIPAAHSDPAALTRIAEHLAAMQRRSASIVGRAADVAPLWWALAPNWGPARDERLNQPLMVAGVPPEVVVDPAVRRAREADARALYPATVAMFTEEVGVSPLAASSEASYRARLMWLIRAGRVYCRLDDRGVVFKAEVAAVAAGVCQIQGVWVRPDRRNRGIGSAGMAAVAALAAREHAATVSLYVNDYNGAALTAYQRAGFRPVDVMSSVHF